MDAAPTRILAIDDSVDIREFFQFVLERAGYDVQLAADGVEGLNLARTFRPHLIVTDVSMPRMNGLEFLVRLRSDVAPPLPPVVVCSGFDVTAEEALRLGAIRFVAKPIESTTLLSIVEQALRGEVGDAASLAREREFMRAARARAAAAAARLLAGIDLQSPDLLRAFKRLVQWVADYFGYADAGLCFVQGAGDVQAVALSRGSPFSAGSMFSGQALYTTGVLASGSSLVLADAAALPQFGDPKVAAYGIRFLVGVALLVEHVPVGALVLADQTPHSFDAEDLVILEQIGRFVSGRLAKIVRPLGERTLAGQNVGLVPPALFDSMLGAEVSILHRERGGLDLILVEVDPASLHPDWLARLAAQPRLGFCRRDTGTLAIFKRDAAPSAASAAIFEVLTALRAVATVQAVGWVSLSDEGMTRVPAHVLLQLAAAALEEAQLAPARPVERLVIRRHEWVAEQVVVKE